MPRMAALTRHSIDSGDYLDDFRRLPCDLLWTTERIRRSLEDTLAARPPGEDIWIFGYGSLIWNPLFAFDRRTKASLYGWHRSFCLRMVAGRGDTQAPGRMLALEPDGHTRGIAFRLAPATAREDLELIWRREMPTGAYRPIWAQAQLDDGEEVSAIVFVADSSYTLYERDVHPELIAPLIARARGHLGSNAEYVSELDLALTAHGMPDAYVSAVAAQVARHTNRR